VLDLGGYGLSLLAGTWLTVQTAILSLIIAVALGVAGALAKTSKSVALQTVATVYTTLIRGVPDLVLMLLIFFGGQMAVNQIAESVGYEEYIEVSAFTAGVLTIGFIYGAYMTETFRGAILAVPPGQLEAGQAFGMSRWQVFREILVPQTIRYALPGFGNNWLVLLKTTALLSVIGLADVLFLAGKAAGSTRQPFTFYLAAALVYLFLTTISTGLLTWAEQRAERPYRRPAHGR
jgi:arginine/ornithine transport system permease protein